MGGGRLSVPFWRKRAGKQGHVGSMGWLAGMENTVVYPPSLVVPGEALCLGTQAWHLVLLRRTCSHRQGWPLWALEAGFRVDEIELGRDDNGRALVAKPGGWLLGQVTLGGLQEMRESSKWAKQS